MPARPSWRITVFVIVLLALYLSWAVFMTGTQQWQLFMLHWPMSVTMVFGSFVAGASAMGGGAVAYPVFTKLLAIESADARTFALMIQTVGMGMASLFIWANRIRVLWRAVAVTVAGGLIGMLAGTFWLQIPSPYQKLLLTYVITLFGVIMIYVTWASPLDVFTDIKRYTPRRALLLFAVGVGGGVLSANVGTGADILFFIVVTLVFGIDEKIAVPSSVIVMAANAALGFLLHAGVVGDVGQVFDWWLVCVPVVAIGAPFGAFVVSLCRRHQILSLMLGLIALELASTLVLVEQDGTTLLVGLAILACSAWLFMRMLSFRVRVVQPEHRLAAGGATGNLAGVPRRLGQREGA